MSVSKNRRFVKSNLKNTPQILQTRLDNGLKAPNRDSPVYPRNRKTRNDYLNNITFPTQKSNVFTHCTGTNTVGAAENRTYRATTETAQETNGCRTREVRRCQAKPISCSSPSPPSCANSAGESLRRQQQAGQHPYRIISSPQSSHAPHLPACQDAP